MGSPDPKASRPEPLRTDVEQRAYERFVRRGRVHGADVEDWLEAERDLLDTASTVEERTSGISNRESAAAEESERQRLKPAENEPTESAEPEGDRASLPAADEQTSNKAGSRSRGQKQAGSRYADRSMPAAKKAGGAFGKEPRDVPND